MLALLKPIVLTFLKSEKFKLFVVDLLETLSKESDNDLIDRIRSGEATTADLKAAADWLYKNDITGVAFDTSPLSQLADIMPTVDFDTVQKSVIKNGS